LELQVVMYPTVNLHKTRYVNVCVTERERERYIDRYIEREGISLPL
jgi:hypothetical protein